MKTYRTVRAGDKFWEIVDNLSAGIKIVEHEFASEFYYHPECQNWMIAEVKGRFPVNILEIHLDNNKFNDLCYLDYEDCLRAYHTRLRLYLDKWMAKKIEIQTMLDKQMDIMHRLSDDMIEFKDSLVPYLDEDHINVLFGKL